MDNVNGLDCVYVFCVRSMFCDAIIGVLLSLPIIMLRTRDLDALLYLCSDCLCFMCLPRGAVGKSGVGDCGGSSL